MLAPLTPHVGLSDVRAHASRVAPCHGVGAPLNAAGRAGALRPRQGQALTGVSSLTHPSPVVERGLFFPRDRLRLQAADRACVVVRTAFHLHVRVLLEHPEITTVPFGHVQIAFADRANA